MSKKKLSNKQIDYLTSFISCERVRSLLAKQLERVSIREKNIPKLMSHLKDMYNKSLMQPGEACGIVAAQNIGETMTQKTLNSIDWAERVVVCVDNKYVENCIGNIIHKYMDLYFSAYVEKLDMSVDRLDLETINIDMKILGADENGNVQWRQVEALIRHPIDNNLLKVCTDDGRAVCATSSESFLVAKNGKLCPTRGSDLVIGDLLPVTCKYTPSTNVIARTKIDLEDNVHVLPLDNMLGFFIGAYLSCGRINNYSISISNKNSSYINKVAAFCEKIGVSVQYTRSGIDMYSQCLLSYLDKQCDRDDDCKIPEFTYGAPDEFVTSMLDGYICGINFSQFCSRSERLIDGFIFLLNRFGIYSVKKRVCNMHILLVSGEELLDLLSPLTVPSKQICLNTALLSVSKLGDVVLSKISSITNVLPSTNYVFDFTVKDVKNFNIMNGLAMRDTFHASGISVKTVITGVPRFSELIGSTKNPKSVLCIIYPEIQTNTLKDIKELGKKVCDCKFKSLVENCSLTASAKKWYDAYSKLYDVNIPAGNIIRCRLKKKLVFENSIDLADVAKKVEKFLSDRVIDTDNGEWVTCIWSPVNIACIDIISNANIPITCFKDIQVYGVDGIKDVDYKKSKDGWYIEAEGSDILGVLSVAGVDKTRTVCNDMWKIYELLGIEATRQFIINELKDVICGDGSFVHEGNIKLLVDSMTHTGVISSVSRYSVKKSDTGVLGKASFEESFSNLIDGAQRGETDPITSVSSAVIVGRGISIGTGLCTLIQQI